MIKNVKITTIPRLLDLIAPHSCRGCGHTGAILCPRCKNYILRQRQLVCPNCKTPLKSASCPRCKSLPRIYTIGPREGLLDDLIHTYKYESVRALAPVFAELLDEILPQDLPENTLVVPLPTSTKHIRERGLDHTLLIAKHLARLRGWRVSRPLERVKNTVQVGSSKSTRLAQADAAYRVKDNFVPDSSATYLILDDVWTTGATIKAVLKKLRAAGVDHICVALLAYSELA